MYYFYILKCKDGSFYCGSTNNLEERLKKHNSGKGSKYVRSRGGGELAYKEACRSLSSALKREAEVKTWDRNKKLELIKKHAAIYANKKIKK